MFTIQSRFFHENFLFFPYLHVHSISSYIPLAFCYRIYTDIGIKGIDFVSVLDFFAILFSFW